MLVPAHSLGSCHLANNEIARFHLVAHVLKPSLALVFLAFPRRLCTHWRTIGASVTML
jgi:hypothetical protein